MKKEKSIFAQRLIAARELRDMQRQEFAEAVDVSPAAITAWENDRNRPSTDKLPLIAQVLRVSLDWLLDVKWTNEAG